MSVETTFPSTENNIAWIDVLRILACFMVVLSHSCGPFMSQFTDNESNYKSVVALGSIVRPCVPLFAMITGYLLFPITTGTSDFYSRRIKKVVIPLVFWSLVTPFFFYGYFSFFETSYPHIQLGDFTLDITLTKLYLFFFNFSYDTIPLWYIYMLIGLYLVMPIFGAWLNQASQKDVKIFLMLWGVSMIVPLLEILAPYLGYEGNFGSMAILGSCLWNPYGTFYYFSGFIGYAVLAYYLKKYPLNWGWLKTLSVTIPLYITGFLITYYGFVAVAGGALGSYEYFEIPWYYTGINVFMMTISIYLVVSKIRFKDCALMSRLAGLTLGIFLCHFFFLHLIYDLLNPLLRPYFTNAPSYEILIIALAVFILSAVIVWGLSKNRFTEKII